jgi:hypothetical protein
MPHDNRAFSPQTCDERLSRQKFVNRFQRGLQTYPKC